ncbi:MAG: cation:dicarboxylase symporter family transporter [Alphaproteobacteria bacterium]|nr:cation:dicarboxylase symporter family transporter [Alphaproteobacteria bacterium]
MVIAALAAGVGFGFAAQAMGGARFAPAVSIIESVGAVWLGALRMTVVPLVYALLVSGIGSVANAVATGRLAARALALFAGLLFLAIGYAIAASTAGLALAPIDPAQARNLIEALGGGAVSATAPTAAQWLSTFAPANPVQAAAEENIVQIVIFAALFGFAVTRLPQALRDPLLMLHTALAEAMVIIVRWVLYAAPIGVFALSIGVASRAGAGVVGLIAHYVAFVSAITAGSCLIAFLVGAVFSRVGPARFAQAAAPVWTVALSTQSSLASLPVMIARSRDVLAASERVVDLVLPLAVAVFRFTSPIANLAVVFFLARLHGVELSGADIAAGALVALAISIGTVGLPGQASFFASVAPICLAMGAPVILLPVLLAVEVIPDIFRTLGNVTADMAAVAILDRGAADDRDERLG